MNKKLFVAMLSGVLALGFSQAASASLVAIDIAQFASNPTQAGFTQWLIAQDQPAGGTMAVTNVGAYTLTISAGDTVACLSSAASFTGFNIRGRTPSIANSGDFTQSDLMKERIANTGGTGNLTTGTGRGLYLKITGLEANKQYLLQAWGVDQTGTPATLKTGTEAGFDATYEATTGLTKLGQYTVAASQTSIIDNNAYSIVGTFTADSTGTIIYKAIGNIDGAVLSGFTLDAIPEPATIGLMGVIGVCLFWIRRRIVR